MTGLFLLSEAYRNTFVDDTKYVGRVASHLAGLASAIEDSHPNWRPKVSQLVLMLPKSETSNSIVAAGMAYGAGKGIMQDYPGPAILLFGAALNVIGSAPNVELQDAVNQAEEILKENGLEKVEEVKKLIQAGKERASFDKVTQMLKNEFTQGLEDSGKYSHETITNIVPNIVNVTHDVRHRGLIERIEWKNIRIEIGGSSTNAGYMHEIDEVVFGDDILQGLVKYAKEGCAFSILRRLTQ